MHNHFSNEKLKQNVNTFMLPSCLKGVETFRRFDTVKEPAHIIIDSEKELVKGPTKNETFTAQLQVYKEPPRIKFCEKNVGNFTESINHLKEQKLILIACSHTTDKLKMSLHFFTDVMPFEKVKSLSVDRENKYFDLLIVANDRRKDPDNVIMTMSTFNCESKPAKIINIKFK